MPATTGHQFFARTHSYENAVAKFEPTYRKVFDFLGLSWDPAVVEFRKHAAEKFIASPDRTQVTQPLYSSSVVALRIRVRTRYNAMSRLSTTTCSEAYERSCRLQ
jgi:hypothetical protein